MTLLFRVRNIFLPERHPQIIENTFSKTIFRKFFCRVEVTKVATTLKKKYILILL